jgi:hypothetical protein
MSRSKGKVSLARRFRYPLVAGVLAVLLGGGLQERGWAAEGTTEKIAVDPLSGIAIFGYDPVGYYLYGKPTSGKSEHEWRWSGVVWRFESAANLDAFRRSPEVFAPAYGGYDAEGVLRRTPTMPDPTVFRIIDDRLFLFRSPEALERFVEENAIAFADRAWSEMAAGLRP